MVLADYTAGVFLVEYLAEDLDPLEMVVDVVPEKIKGFSGMERST